MILFPNAKINIGLFVTEKRADGFHNLESCFYPIPWCDALEIVPAEYTKFTSSGILIPGSEEDNLCLKVYRAIKNDFDIPPVHIHLHKNIPIGAGMGGGSSDAAFTGKIINELFDLKLTEEQLEDYVRPLGSDCAFFVKNKPVYAHEKGDRFKETTLSLKGNYLYVVYPGIHISTKEAYSGVVPKKPEMDVIKLMQENKISWREHLKNDFEKSVFPNYPEIEDIKNKFYDSGAFYASMTGSGSAVIGIFESKPSKNLFEHQNYIEWKGELSF